METTSPAAEIGPLALVEYPHPALARRAKPVMRLDDPLAAMAAPVSLQDHLRWHFAAVVGTAEERRRAAFHLIDVAEPMAAFSAALFERLAREYLGGA